MTPDEPSGRRLRAPSFLPGRLASGRSRFPRTSTRAPSGAGSQRLEAAAPELRLAYPVGAGLPGGGAAGSDRGSDPEPALIDPAFRRLDSASHPPGRSQHPACVAARLWCIRHAAGTAAWQTTEPQKRAPAGAQCTHPLASSAAPAGNRSARHAPRSAPLRPCRAWRPAVRESRCGRCNPIRWSARARRPGPWRS